jgi:hypothetical protein
MTPTAPELRPEDFVGSYNLPDSLEATIPTGHEPGEPGIYWVARGLLAETCAQLLGRPISLDLLDHPHTVFIHALISLASTVLSAEPLGDVASVELVVVKHNSRWALIVDNRLLAMGLNVPAPAHLAGLVAANHHQRRSAAQPTCRGPVTPPKHLW